MRYASNVQNTQAAPVRRMTGFSLWAWWVLATTLGGALGLVLAEGLFVVGYIFHADIENFEAYVISSLSLWATVGMAQWLFLRRYIAKLALWVPATAFGGLVFLGLSSLPSLIWKDFYDYLPRDYWTAAVPISLIGAIFGFCLGLAQWVVLARRFSNCAWWILASAVGLTVALVVGGGLSEAIREKQHANWGEPESVLMGIAGPLGIEAGILMFSLYAAITGLALVWLLRQPVVEREATRISSAPEGM